MVDENYKKLLEDQKKLLKLIGKHIFVRGSLDIALKVPEMEQFSATELITIIARCELLQIVEERDGHCRVKVRLEGNEDFKDGECFLIPVTSIIRIANGKDFWFEELHGPYIGFGEWKHLKN